MSYVLILGAKSDIAKATAREYAKHGYDLYLAARNVNTLEPFVQDIQVRTNRNVELIEWDMLAYESHDTMFNSLKEMPLGVVLVAGYLGDQKVAQSSFDEALKITNSNYTGAVSMLNIVANTFEKRRSGFIVGVSSVAGDRGRKTNYIYGASKAALTAYLSGLRNRLYESQVDVLTAMTKELDLPERLTAEPEEVAEAIYKAQQNRKNVIYTKGIWRLVMFIIKLIPEWQFKKMSI